MAKTMMLVTATMLPLVNAQEQPHGLGRKMCERKGQNMKAENKVGGEAFIECEKDVLNMRLGRSDDATGGSEGQVGEWLEGGCVSSYTTLLPLKLSKKKILDDGPLTKEACEEFCGTITDEKIVAVGFRPRADRNRNMERESHTHQCACYYNVAITGAKFKENESQSECKMMPKQQSHDNPAGEPLREPLPEPLPENLHPWRPDLRCGEAFKNYLGEPAQCNPDDQDGFTCCSDAGWCGKSRLHCSCNDCLDYSHDKSKWKCVDEKNLPRDDVNSGDTSVTRCLQAYQKLYLNKSGGYWNRKKYNTCTKVLTWPESCTDEWKETKVCCPKICKLQNRATSCPSEEEIAEKYGGGPQMVV